MQGLTLAASPADVAYHRSPYRTHVKRWCDVVMASAALAILAPFAVPGLALLAIVHGRPVFFSQVRVGLNGRCFTLYKLRTMRVGAEKGDATTGPGDERITPLGRWLRRLSIDELPQLWNVIRGDMGIVGPRPDAAWQIRMLRHRDATARCSVRPGITGLAQVSGRSHLTLDQRLACDLEYVARCSASVDIRIILLTALQVTTKGAW